MVLFDNASTHKNKSIYHYLILCSLNIDMNSEIRSGLLVLHQMGVI